MPKKSSLGRQSAGLLLFRRRDGDLQVLLGHPGGPFLRSKDEGASNIPKGSVSAGEALLSAARREFAEETGHHPRDEFIPLGEAKQPGGKGVHVWAVEDDLDAENIRSNMFEMEWPPRSGRLQKFPEIDRADWFSIPVAQSEIRASNLRQPLAAGAC